MTEPAEEYECNDRLFLICLYLSICSILSIACYGAGKKQGRKEEMSKHPVVSVADPEPPKGWMVIVGCLAISPGSSFEEFSITGRPDGTCLISGAPRKGEK